MKIGSRLRFLLLTLLTVPVVADRACVLSHAQSAPSHIYFRVQAASSLPAPISGRVLVFLKQGSGDKEVETNEFRLGDAFVAAREVHNLAPGASVEIDGDDVAYPKPISEYPAGTYEAQAVIDVDHTYNYSGRGPQDWLSDVVPLPNWNPASGAEPVLTLDHHPEDNPRRVDAIAKAHDEAKPGVAQLEELESPLLTRFWGHSTKIRAWVILPPGYDPNGSTTYPTAYETHGFGGFLDA